LLTLINPSVVEKHELTGKYYALEIDLARIVLNAKTKQAPKFSSMSVVKEDLAFVVDKNVEAFALIETIKASIGQVLESVRLFDVYEGGNIGDSKKSLAFNLRLRSLNQTLKTEEIADIRQKVIAAVEKNHGGVLRA